MPLNIKFESEKITMKMRYKLGLDTDIFYVHLTGNEVKGKCTTSIKPYESNILVFPAGTCAVPELNSVELV